MRLRLSLLFALLPALLFGQVWEKLFAPGITYRMEVDAATPRVIHALRIDPRAATVKAVAGIGRLSILANDSLKGRKTVSEAVAQTGALGGINADFFPFTGDPLGLMIRSGELLSAPNPARAVFAWGPGGAACGKATWSADLTPDGDAPTPVDGLNCQCGWNELVVNSPAAGMAVATAKMTAVYAVVKVNSASWTPQGVVEGEFRVLYEVPSMSIQPDNTVLVATGTKAATLKALRPGQKVRVKFNVGGFDWTKYDNAVGGGPILVAGGRPKVDGVEEGFPKASFVDKRHPRSAVGRTAEGDLWFVVVDGRQKMSDGASLDELAQIMVRLGCVDAINLDGGGSSALDLFGLTLNRPSDGTERAVADMILLMGNPAAPEPMQPTLVAPPMIALGDTVTLSVKNDKGDDIPNAEVIWTAGGNAWIDQGGLLHLLGPGSVTVRAIVKGHRLEVTIPIQAPPSKT